MKFINNRRPSIPGMTGISIYVDYGSIVMRVIDGTIDQEILLTDEDANKLVKALQGYLQKSLPASVEKEGQSDV